MRCVLQAHSDVLSKRTVELLLLLGRACLDENIVEAEGVHDGKAVLQVATEALNTLMFALTEGVDALGNLSKGTDERTLRCRAAYLRGEYAASLLGADSSAKLDELAKASSGPRDELRSWEGKAQAMTKDDDRAEDFGLPLWLVVVTLVLSFVLALIIGRWHLASLQGE